MACVNSPSVLEECEGIVFGPYNLGYPNLAQHLQSARIDISNVINKTIDNNQWMQVEDSTQKEGETHWQLSDMKNFSPVLKTIEGMEAPALVVPIPNVTISIH